MPDNLPVPVKGKLPAKVRAAPPEVPDEYEGLVIKTAVSAKPGEHLDRGALDSMKGKTTNVNAVGKTFVAQVTEAGRDDKGQLVIEFTVWVPRGMRDQWSVLLDSLGQIVAATGGRMNYVSVPDDTIKRASDLHVAATTEQMSKEQPYEQPRVGIDAGRKAIARRKPRKNYYDAEGPLP